MLIRNSLFSKFHKYPPLFTLHFSKLQLTVIQKVTITSFKKYTTETEIKVIPLNT